MSVVVSLEDFRPAPRYDGTAVDGRDGFRKGQRSTRRRG